MKLVCKILGDFINCYKLQSSRRVKIAKEVIDTLGWSEGDTILEFLDPSKKLVILIRKEDLDSVQ